MHNTYLAQICAKVKMSIIAVNTNSPEDKSP